MGIFDRFKQKEVRAKQLLSHFEMIQAYSPAFRTFGGGVYEMELSRAAIHTFASHASKANPVIQEKKYKNLEMIIRNKPNPIMTGSQFLYKIASIYKSENNVFIIPLYEDRTAGKITGLYPVRGSQTEIRKVGTKMMLKYYTYENMETPHEHWIPYEEVGHLRNHFYRKELFGESNQPMEATLNLMSTQQQAIINSVQQSATIRFMAKVGAMLKDEDIDKERIKLRNNNLSIDNNGGVFLYDAKLSDVKQVDSKPFTIDADQVKLINENVYNYFGVNDAIIQSKASESQFELFYETQIEPFLIELSQMVTNMLFNYSEISKGSMCIFEASRLQYASTKTKMELWQNGFDRGLFSRNEGRTLFNMAPIDNGDEYFIRLEYGSANGQIAEVVENDQ